MQPNDIGMLADADATFSWDFLRASLTVTFTNATIARPQWQVLERHLRLPQIASQKIGLGVDLMPLWEHALKKLEMSHFTHHQSEGNVADGVLDLQPNVEKEALTILQ